MSEKHEQPRHLPEVVHGPLGSTAYVVVDDAHCLYQPDLGAAIRCTPPYGTKVGVLQERGEWVQVFAFGKKAWSHRANLSPNPAPQRQAVEVGVQPEAGRYCGSSLRIEYGPRGGRFVRTASGFRRYL